MFVSNEVKVCDGCILSTCVLLQGVLPLLTAEQHHQLDHGGRRLERVDCLMENDVRRVDWTEPDVEKSRVGGIRL